MSRPAPWMSVVWWMRRRAGWRLGRVATEPSSSIGAAQPPVSSTIALAPRGGQHQSGISRATPDQNGTSTKSSPARSRTANRRAGSQPGGSARTRASTASASATGSAIVSTAEPPSRSGHPAAEKPLREMGWSGTTDGGSGHRAPMPGNLPSGSDNFASRRRCSVRGTTPGRSCAGTARRARRHRGTRTTVPIPR